MTDDPLTALRREIDRIDGDMHALLMERGAIIDRLVDAKGTAASGSAFRPEREAAMMRVLAERHRGRLPFAAVEGIWRVIIATFTHVQAPFAVHVATGADAVRDAARFHFGFVIPLQVQPDIPAVIAAVAASRGDLGLLPWRESREAWWQSLEPDAAPKIIARLPFLDRVDPPAGLPLLVVSRRISEEGTGAVVLRSAYGGSANGARREGEAAQAIADAGCEVLARAGDTVLVAAPRAVPVEAVAEAIGASRIRLVGSHPEIVAF